MLSHLGNFSAPSRCCRSAIDDPVFMELLNETPCKPIVYIKQQPGPSTPPSQPRTVDAEGTADSVKTLPQTERRAAALPGDTYEHFLLGFAQSLMMEAVRGELVLTAHPHTNILPSCHR